MPRPISALPTALVGVLSLALLSGCEDPGSGAPPPQSPREVNAQETPPASPAPASEPSQPTPLLTKSISPPSSSLGESPLPEPISGSTEPAEALVATASAGHPDVPKGPDGEPPTGEALEQAKRVVAEARAVASNRSGAVARVGEALFAPALDHYAPALDLRGQFFHLEIQPADAKGNATAWYLRAEAYGFAPGVPGQATGWRYPRLATYGLGHEVRDPNAGQHTTSPQPARSRRASPGE